MTIMKIAIPLTKSNPTIRSLAIIKNCLITRTVLFCACTMLAIRTQNGSCENEIHDLYDEENKKRNHDRIGSIFDRLPYLLLKF